MKYAKIVIKDRYEQKGDLVLRSYIRAIKKIKANLLLGLNLFSDSEKAYVYGVIKDDNKFHEFFTDRVIDYDNYEIVPEDGIIVLRYIPLDEITKIKNVIEKVIFNEDIKLGFEVSTIDDLALDRKIEFEGFNNELSGVCPYPRLGKPGNSYDDFQYKIGIINKMKIQNQPVDNYDEYEVHSYQPRPGSEDESKHLVYNISKFKSLGK